jgi:hypothetical protein
MGHFLENVKLFTPTPLICVTYFLNFSALDRDSTCGVEIICEQVRSYCNCFKVVAENPIYLFGYECARQNTADELCLSSMLLVPGTSELLLTLLKLAILSRTR